jgi:hypothetical protein
MGFHERAKRLVYSYGRPELTWAAESEGGELSCWASSAGHGRLPRWIFPALDLGSFGSAKMEEGTAAAGRRSQHQRLSSAQTSAEGRCSST